MVGTTAADDSVCRVGEGEHDGKARGCNAGRKLEQTGLEGRRRRRKVGGRRQRGTGRVSGGGGWRRRGRQRQCLEGGQSGEQKGVPVCKEEGDVVHLVKERRKIGAKLSVHKPGS